MSTLVLHLFGPPRLVWQGQPLPVQRRKALAMLAYLARRSGPQARDSVATLLWPDLDQSRARATLRATLAALRRDLAPATTAVGPWIIADRQNLQLDPEAGIIIDVSQFEAYLNRGDLGALEQAVALYQDDFLAGFTLRGSSAFDDWLSWQTEQLRNALHEGLQSLCAQQTNPGQAIPYARRWAQSDPLHEPAHEALLRCLLQTGQRQAARQHFDSVVALLDQELGIPPSPALSAWVERTDVPRPTADTADEKRDSLRQATLASLPLPSTPFIGRHRERRQVQALLQDQTQRLVTIVGPGGIGKSRLALAVAKDFAARLDNQKAVVYASLVDVADPTTLFLRLGEILSLQQGAGTQLEQTVIDFLGSRPYLLLLDNCDDLALNPAAVAWLSQLMTRATDLQIMATSRARLSLQSETTLVLAGLPTPTADDVMLWDLLESGAIGPVRPQVMQTAAQQRISLLQQLAADQPLAVRFDALHLFQQAARRVRPDYRLGQDDLVPVATICRLVAGLPLGIELAAAWIESLSTAEIATEIAHNQELLQVEWLDLPERHRSLQAVCESTWQWLTEPERQQLNQLSVFSGGFTRPAAAAVAGLTLPTLNRLSGKSLIRYDGTGRYTLHELLQQYAASRLAAAPALKAKAERDHARYTLTLLPALGERLRGRDQESALALLAADWQNIDKAWRWAVTEQAFALLLPVIPTIWYYHHLQTTHEAAYRQLAQAAAALGAADLGAVAGTPPLLLAQLLALAAHFAGVLGRVAEAQTALATAEQLIGRHQLAARMGLPRVLMMLAYMIFGETERARAIGRDAEIWAKQQSERWTEAATFSMLGGAYWLTGDATTARPLLERSSFLFRQVGDWRSLANNLALTAEVQLIAGHITAAQAEYEACLHLSRRCNDQLRIMSTLQRLGDLAILQGNEEEAQPYFSESLAISGARGDRSGLASARLGLAQAAVLRGDEETATQTLWELLAFCEGEDTLAYLRTSVLAELLPFLPSATAAQLGPLILAQPYVSAADQAKALAYQDREGSPMTDLELPEQALGEAIAGLLATGTGS